MYSVEKYGVDFLIRNGVSHVEGINGRIKCLYEDFHVHEITRNNEVLHLTQLIDRNKIESYLLKNREKEQQKVVDSLNNVDLQFLSQYLNEENQNIFKQFINILYELYELKEKEDQLNDDLKNISVPYCFLLEVDLIKEQVQNGNQKEQEEKEKEKEKGKEKEGKEKGSINTEKKTTNIKEHEYEEQEKTNQYIKEMNIKKSIRKEIHNFIRNCYPFLVSETKSVGKEKTQVLLSHGNLFKDSAKIKKNNEHLYFPNEIHLQKEKTGIIIYPSITCLKVILPFRLFKTLEKKSKKCRYLDFSELENIDLKELDKTFPSTFTSIPTDSCQFTFSSINDVKLIGYRDNTQNTNNVENLTPIEKKRKLTNGNFVIVNKKVKIKNDVPIFQNVDNTTEKKVKGNESCDKKIVECDNTQMDEYNGQQEQNGKNEQNEQVEQNGKNEQNYTNNEHSVENFQQIKKRKKREKTEKKYLHFNLYKENKDICEILNKMKICFNKKSSDISYCGIKDKRGITVQRFCIAKTKKEDLLKLIMKNEKWFNNVFISNIEYKKKRLALGNLKGNYFKILIRGVDNDAYTKCQVLCENLKKYGFVNYFGEQRFGNRQVKNYEIGMKILKKQYKDALLLCVPNTELDEEEKQILFNYINAISDKEGVEEIKHVCNGEHYGKCDKRNCRRKEEKKWKKKKQNKKQNKKQDTTQVVEKVKREEKKGGEDGKEKTREEIKSKKGETSIELEQTEPTKETESSTENKKAKNFQEFQRVVNAIPKKIYVERIILNALKNSKNFKHAFMSVPRDIFSLFIHSTQSLIFNILVNLRMKKFGMKVVVGDLVQVGPEEEDEEKDENKDENNDENKNKEETVDKKIFKSTYQKKNEDIKEMEEEDIGEGNSNSFEESNIWNSEFSSAYLEDSSSEVFNINQEKKKMKNWNNETDEQKKKRIVAVTEENIHMFNIYDVVLPLPGDQNIIYPQNLIKEYETVLKHFNLTFEDFKSDKKFFNSSGCFRKVVVKPSNVKLIFIPNESEHMNSIPMLKSDLCKLREHVKMINTQKQSDREKEKEEEKEEEKEAKEGNETNDTPHSTFTNTPEELKELEENVFFSSHDQHHERLLQTVPNYQFKSSIFFSCVLPKSCYITIALKEVLNNSET